PDGEQVVAKVTTDHVHVEVEVDDYFLKCMVFEHLICADFSMLFGVEGDEQQVVRQLVLGLAEISSQLEQGGYARGVVIRAVVDLPITNPEAIVVRGDGDDRAA